MRDFDPTASEYISIGYLARSRPGGQLYDVGSVIGAVAGPLIGGLLGSDAAGDAADTQAASTDRATALQKQMFDKQVELQEPFRQAGLTSQNRLMDLLGLSGNKGAAGYGSLMRDFGMADFKADPGYQWRMDQGQRALERSAAARGGLLSGAAMKAASDYGQNQASSEYTNAFNRFQTNRANKLNPLQSLMGASQTAAGQQAQAASNYGTNVGNLMTNMGNAQAASQIAQGNAWTGAINSGWNNYQQNQLMSKLFPSTPASTSWGSLNNQYFTGTGGMGD